MVKNVAGIRCKMCAAQKNWLPISMDVVFGWCFVDARHTHFHSLRCHSWFSSALCLMCAICVDMWFCLYIFATHSKLIWMCRRMVHIFLGIYLNSRPYLEPHYIVLHHLTWVIYSLNRIECWCSECSAGATKTAWCMLLAKRPKTASGHRRRHHWSGIKAGVACAIWNRNGCQICCQCANVWFSYDFFHICEAHIKCGPKSRIDLVDGCHL